MIKKISNRAILLLLILLLIALLLLSLSFGAIEFSLGEIVNALCNCMTGSKLAFKEIILIDIRLPRILMSIVAGAVLGISGFVVQQIFRNPIVEPGLIGTSSGAAFGASIFIVFGLNFPTVFQELGLPFFSVIGASIATILVFVFASLNGRHSTVVLLLLGIAVNAIFMSGVGFMSYIAKDPQARSITFWGLGTLSQVTWPQFVSVFIVAAIEVTVIVFFLPQLKLLQLGEENAQLLGIQVNKLKWLLICVVVISVAILTSIVGIIAFVGLIAPHLSSLINQSKYERNIGLVAIIGSIILLASDLLCRVLLAPIELPIGILTSLVGAPIFIFMLKRLKWNL